MYIVSACLAGINCRYNGGNTLNQRINEMVQNGEAFPICPELLGGLETPREPCEIVSAKNEVIKISSCDGLDYTDAYVKGANETLKICESMGVTEAIFQQRSPSCGCGCIYDGTFSGGIIQGDGMTTHLLKSHGIKVMSDEEWTKKLINK